MRSAITIVKANRHSTLVGRQNTPTYIANSCSWEIQCKARTVVAYLFTVYIKQTLIFYLYETND